MNRDEALDKIINGSTRENVQVKLINKIYNDFESRTCEGCSYFRGCSIDECTCDNELSMGYTYTDLTKFDGCNKWEKKDD